MIDMQATNANNLAQEIAQLSEEQQAEFIKLMKAMLLGIRLVEQSHNATGQLKSQ